MDRFPKKFAPLRSEEFFNLWVFNVTFVVKFCSIVSSLSHRRMAEKPAFSAMASRGIIGGIVAITSFGAIMFATRLDKVGEVLGEAGFVIKQRA